MLKGYELGAKHGDDLFEDIDVDLMRYLITYRQLNQALNGDPFYLDSKGADTHTYDCVACPPDVFWYYYRMFERCDAHGLPHGKGWLDEVDWVLDLIEGMRPIKDFYFSRGYNGKS